MKSAGKFAIIIPVGPSEDAWEALLPDLLASPLPKDTEIVFAGTTQAPRRFDSFINKQVDHGDHRLSHNTRWIKSPRGRAKQLNAGARATHNEYLWFLHADSRISPDTFSTLTRCVRRSPKALHFFNLRFMNDGPALTHLNSLGVWVRSHLLGLPFGDQGFCISRELFTGLGGFSEAAAYGEDHLLVWKARKRGIPLRCTDGSIFTSARKYRNQGWSKTTLEHLWLTTRQALPELSDWIATSIWGRLS